MTKGYEWAQAQYDRQEPFLPVCEGCGRTVDAVADIDGTRLCEACVSEWLLNHLDIMMFVWLVIMITAIILLRKNKANFLSFIIPWFMGLVGCLTVVFGIL